MISSVESLRELAIMQPGEPVLSVHVRTDPRDPANTGGTPKWLVELRNGLREVAGAANGENHAVSGWLGGSCAPRSNVRCSSCIREIGHGVWRGFSHRMEL